MTKQNSINDLRIWPAIFVPCRTTLKQHGKRLSSDLPTFPSIRQILICGMGGSAIEDLLSAYLSEIMPVPVSSWRNYGLPAWAQGEDCLVICSSHSGNTEEL